MKGGLCVMYDALINSKKSIIERDVKEELRQSESINNMNRRLCFFVSEILMALMLPYLYCALEYGEYLSLFFVLLCVGTVIAGIRATILNNAMLKELKEHGKILIDEADSYSSVTNLRRFVSIEEQYRNHSKSMLILNIISMMFAIITGTSMIYVLC